MSKLTTFLYSYKTEFSKEIVSRPGGHFRNHRIHRIPQGIREFIHIHIDIHHHRESNPRPVYPLRKIAARPCKCTIVPSPRPIHDPPSTIVISMTARNPHIALDGRRQASGLRLKDIGFCRDAVYVYAPSKQLNRRADPPSKSVEFVDTKSLCCVERIISDFMRKWASVILVTPDGDKMFCFTYVS